MQGAYELAALLWERGFRQVWVPSKVAAMGHTVIVIVYKASDLALSQRRIFETCDKDMVKSVKNGEIKFKNGGRMIFKPGSCHVEFFAGLDRTKTFYYIDRS